VENNGQRDEGARLFTQRLNKDLGGARKEAMRSRGTEWESVENNEWLE